MATFYSQALKIGLLMVWLCGFVLILISFYATTQIPPSSFTKDEQIKNLANSVGPTVTIFAAARPFIGWIGSKQSLAVRSWLDLSQDIRVVLFSQDSSVFSFAESFGHHSRVSVEPNIDYTFLGTPFFHSMVARAQASDSDISVLMDSETILFPDFISTLSFVHKLDHDWILFVSSRNISDFSFQLDAYGQHWIGDNSQRIKTEKLQEFLSLGWREHCDDMNIIMAWNNIDIPLHNGVLPPFLYGQGFHTNWIITEASSSNFRFVFDACLTISSFFVNNINLGPKIEARKWESVGNSHLRALYGSLMFREADYSNVIKLFICNGRYHFGNTTSNIVYPLRTSEGLSFNGLDVFRLRKYKKLFSCFDGLKSFERKAVGCLKKNDLMSLEPLVLPFSLELLLSMRADDNKRIVLAVAGYSYKDMLMSWVCRLHLLQVSNFVVCALDDETYDFGVLQGLPVFRDILAPSNISYDDCHFGTNCFQRVTKVNSRVVLEILKLGYNVLMSDVDVFWFKNPLPLLTAFGPAVFVAQSDEYKITGPINLPRRLNSGFYYAHSDTTTIAALKKVVKHASLSNLSEQPSFYDTLCGFNGSYRLDDDTCQEPETNLTVHFLDRNLFPNGAYRDLWDSSNVSSTCMNIGCFVLHNNWISGRQKKLERQVASGLWEYDTSTRMCLQNWQRFKPISYF
ncbi:beta-arabinofuranosyltransferase RAY1-like [Bidens hawaiensis]|uniref:beta-arabinofuranosyltransferase RAY1-like n=1 Tax=Bidens hawaiensis TaxID=980011 RepID=UPI004049E722